MLIRDTKLVLKGIPNSVILSGAKNPRILLFATVGSH
jgi:hypothetical protein